MIEVKMWNKDMPEMSRIVDVDDSKTAGIFLSGAIQAAVDSGGTLMAEVREKT